MPHAAHHLARIDSGGDHGAGVAVAAQIEAHRFTEIGEATTLFSGPLHRRVSAAIGAERCVYLENGRPVPGLRN